MGKLTDFGGQEVSRQAAKMASDAVWAQSNGISAYRLAGKIFLGCGIGWLLLSIIPMVCGTPMNEWGWMWIVAGIQIIPGIMIIILSKKSKKFQQWAKKDFEKDLKKREKLKEKVKIGKRTLPITNGDILALKILGIGLLLFAILMLCIYYFG